MKTIEPDWAVSPRVAALTTTRHGGCSQGPWARFNLSVGAGDDPEAVEANRQILSAALPAEPCWLAQVHGSRVVHLDDWHPGIEADAAWTDASSQVVAILTADCLPILLADRDASVVAAVHGGWRSLAAGIVSNALAALPVAAEDLHAWIGPGICGRCYQVGDEVREAFIALDRSLGEAFAADGARWRADLKKIATRLLADAGVTVSDASRCTFEEAGAFYSFRRDGRTGRMASLIWLQRPAERAG
jgi:hypothetical protein